MRRQNKDGRSLFRIILTGVCILSWLSVTVTSLNHLYPVCPFFSHFSTVFLGWLGWSTVIFTTVYLARKQAGQLLGIVLLFFFLGYGLGPFLSPASDPVEHLKRVYELNCNSEANLIPRENYGMWQYSMVGIVLCPESIPIDPERQLIRIDIANGMFWALLAGVLFVLGIRAGIPGKWTFLSVLICFLFWGTNRISYFKYYSFSASCISIVFYWLWTAFFFFKKKPYEVFTGLAVALLSLPILWVNHRQEAVFLGFIVIIWLVLNAVFSLNTASSVVTEHQPNKIIRLFRFFTIKRVCLLFVFVVLFVFPQADLFRKWLQKFVVCDYGNSEQLFFLRWFDLFVGGQANALRVKDTLGMTGVVMVLLAVPYFMCGLSNKSLERKVRIYVLAILPFIGYFVPFFHFVWASNIKFATYYRLCYSSMFWLLFADFLFCLEQHFSLLIEKKT